MTTEMKHWYTLVYDWHHNDYRGVATAIVGYDTPLLTRARIEEGKGLALSRCPPENMLFLNATYMGQMTKEEMDGQPLGEQKGEDVDASG